MSSYTATELATIAELSDQGMKDDQIAQEIGRSRTGVRYQMSKMRIVTQSKSNQDKSVMDKKLKDLFEAGCNDDQIALELGLAENTVRHRRSGLGLKRRAFAAGEGFYLGEMIMGARRKALCEVWK